MLRVFIGFDERQPLAFTVAAHSIFVRSTVPVSITPLCLSQLPLHRHGLTSFTYSRYLVPHLCDYAGHALFTDPDILCMGDIAELPWESEHSVCVVPHKNALVRGQSVNVGFERPSVMLFNCAKCSKLTPEYIERGSPQSLEWAESIGELSPEWNHLVGYDAPGPAKIAHFTQGIPCFEETANDEYAGQWKDSLSAATHTVPWEAIMGPSVHAQFKRNPLKSFMSPFARRKV